MFIVASVHTQDNGLRSIWVWPPEPAVKPKGLICVPLKQEWNPDMGASSPHPSTVASGGSGTGVA